jgi:hypothetical protein
MVFTFTQSNIIYIPSAWKIIFKLMKWTCHYPISSIKGLFNTIPMMNVNINIKDSLIIIKQLQDTQHNIINITKPTSFWLLSMMKPSRPIQNRLKPPLIQQVSPNHTRTTIHRTVFIQSIYHRAIITKVISIQLIFK